MWIPAIDLVQGQSVRLYQGDFDKQTIIDADPVAQAQTIAAAGLSRLHLVDLDGAKAGAPRNRELVQAIVAATDLQVEIGGGIRDVATIKDYLELGVDRVILGSVAIEHPDVVAAAVEQFGPERIVVGLDGRDGQVATRGWLTDVGTPMATVLAGMVRLGVRHFIVTDIARDGAMTGPNVELLAALQRTQTNADIIASGGIRDLNDLRQLKQAGIQSAVIGRALAVGSLTLADLKGATNC